MTNAEIRRQLTGNMPAGENKLADSRQVVKTRELFAPDLCEKKLPECRVHFAVRG
jgi:hypothetical protein